MAKPEVADYFGKTTIFNSVHLSKGADYFQWRSRRPQTFFSTPPKLFLTIYLWPQTICTPFRSYIILYVNHSGVEIVCALPPPLERGPDAKRGQPWPDFTCDTRQEVIDDSCMHHLCCLPLSRVLRSCLGAPASAGLPRPSGPGGGAAGGALSH
jgi:hypothetical protein